MGRFFIITVIFISFYSISSIMYDKKFSIIGRKVGGKSSVGGNRKCRKRDVFFDGTTWVAEEAEKQDFRTLCPPLTSKLLSILP